jgi:hypothetical protein
MLGISELESIKEVNIAIQTPRQTPSDALILSVGSLANHSGDEFMWDMNIKSPFQAPLQGLQWLDIYGCLLSNHVHLNGVAQLIKLRKGPENVRLPGLAPKIS